MQIPECEKIIGCQGDNLIEKRQFLISSKYKGVDIRNFSFVLKVQPINVRKLPYYNELQKSVSDDTILLTWEIRKRSATTVTSAGYSYFCKNTPRFCALTDCNAITSVISELKLNA